MRKNSIRARHKRRFEATPNAKHSMPVADNMLNPQFTSEAPNMRWAGDITDIVRAEAAAGINRLGGRIERMAPPSKARQRAVQKLVVRSRR